jgi:protein-disulfide isomerase/uncharacterized membrane protein
MMNTQDKKRIILITLITVLAYITCVILELRAVGSNIASAMCNAGGVFDCNKVTNSSYSKIFGISLSQWGFLFYGFYLLKILHLYVKPKLFKSETAQLLLLSFIANIFSLYLFVVSKFIINAICPFCLILYTLNLILLVFTFKYHSNLKNVFSIKLPYFAFISLCKLFISFCFALIVFSLITANSQKRPQQAAIEDWPRAGSLNLDYNFDSAINGDYYLGNKDAKIQIVEFSDIECPFCRRISVIFDDLLKKHPSDLLFIFKNYPLDRDCNSEIKTDLHKNACFSAEAARCAGEQGAFWKYLNDLFTLEVLEDPKLSSNVVRAALAERVKILNLDEQAFKECLDSKRQKQAILKDVQDGQSLKIKGTPSIWINGKLLDEPSEESIQSIIKSLLNSQKLAGK